MLLQAGPREDTSTVTRIGTSDFFATISSATADTTAFNRNARLEV
jgi:hypothetical protein